MAIVTQQTETERIQQHLQIVEQRLRAKQPSLLPDQLQDRYRNLDRLHEYWVQGEFPRNHTHPHQPIPCFIDPDGRSCAVAHLLFALSGSSNCGSGKQCLAPCDAVSKTKRLGGAIGVDAR